MCFFRARTRWASGLGSIKDDGAPAGALERGLVFFWRGVRALLLGRVGLDHSADLASLVGSQMAVGQNQWYHFGVGAPPISDCVSGDWVRWGYGLLTHGQILISPGNGKMLFLFLRTLHL